MSNPSKPEERVGWELIWRHGNDHPRYGSYAAPDAAVTEWATTLAAGGFILDLGCGVGRHVVYLGGCGFRMAGIDISPSGIRLTREACAHRRIGFDGQVSDMPRCSGRTEHSMPRCRYRRSTITGGMGSYGRSGKSDAYSSREGCCWSIFHVRTPSIIGCCASGSLPGRLPKSNLTPLSTSVLISMNWMMTFCLITIAMRTTCATCCVPSKSSGCRRPCANRRMVRA